jgi:trans-aconitate methyltransferase
LDISKAALEKAKFRLGEKATTVKWIVSNITEFQPEETHDLWYDRATFHCLTEESRIAPYANKVAKAVSQNALGRNLTM